MFLARPKTDHKRFSLHTDCFFCSKKNDASQDAHIINACVFFNLIASHLLTLIHIQISFIRFFSIIKRLNSESKRVQFYIPSVDEATLFFILLQHSARPISNIEYFWVLYKNIIVSEINLLQLQYAEAVLLYFPLQNFPFTRFGVKIFPQQQRDRLPTNRHRHAWLPFELCIHNFNNIKDKQLKSVS